MPRRGGCGDRRANSQGGGTGEIPLLSCRIRSRPNRTLALHHIGNGMFGGIITDPPGLPAVDHEYLFVQSELYLGPQGEPGDLAKMQHEGWDGAAHVR